MLDQIIKKINWLMGKNIEISCSSWIKIKFDWDNDKFSITNEFMEDVSITHPNLLAELLGIIEKGDFIDEDAPVHKLTPVDNAILAAQAAANANLAVSAEVSHELTWVNNGCNHHHVPAITDDKDNEEGEDDDKDDREDKDVITTMNPSY